jgi:hypothetical protein
VTAELINIGPREHLKRRVFGLVALAHGGVSFRDNRFSNPELPRALVFFSVWLAGLGLFQEKIADNSARADS